MVSQRKKNVPSYTYQALTYILQNTVASAWRIFSLAHHSLFRRLSKHYKVSHVEDSISNLKFSQIIVQVQEIADGSAFKQKC